MEKERSGVGLVEMRRCKPELEAMGGATTLSEEGPRRREGGWLVRFREERSPPVAGLLGGMGRPGPRPAPAPVPEISPACFSTW